MSPNNQSKKNNNFILGIKHKMTQIFSTGGEALPVTEVMAGPCQVVQIKKTNSDGYWAVQLGFGYKSKLSKALLGHLQGLPTFRYLKEFAVAEATGSQLSRGQTIKVDTFTVGEKVKVVGVSKGKGFQGVVKRHKFSGSPASHGHKDQLRMPGSIGATDPQRVFKGTRMAGRMGGEQVTVANLEIVKIDKEKNLLYLKGAVPGRRGALLKISGQGELKLSPATVVKATAGKPAPAKSEPTAGNRDSKAETKAYDKDDLVSRGSQLKNQEQNEGAKDIKAGLKEKKVAKASEATEESKDN